MDSPQSLGSPIKGSSDLAEPEKKNNELLMENNKEAAKNNIGVLDVHVHQARDILNICIYHKQDVYAKVCLTSDPENALSTQIINGGGKNPVFNQTLRLNVTTVECSLKCEIWMMSRVKNYMEDQLLGFALVPISEVLVGNGKLEKEFTLSSTDLFHSPSGFVQLSLTYTGSSPDVIVTTSDKGVCDSEEAVESLSSEFEKIEFPDPKIVNENQLMVSEYFGIPCENLDSQMSQTCSLIKVTCVAQSPRSSDSLTSSDTENQIDSPPSIVSTNGSHPANFKSCEVDGASKSPNKDVPPPQEIPKVKSVDAGDSESKFSKPLVSINIVPEQEVVQQDIVDMYMKSMQQFTESLAKMKLPLDIDSGPSSSSGNSSSDQKSETPKSTGSRVFYGSRAFF